jgi:hypothetical protein
MIVEDAMAVEMTMTMAMEWQITDDDAVMVVMVNRGRNISYVSIIIKLIRIQTTQ